MNNDIYYLVGDEKIPNKMYAMLKAVERNLTIKWVFNDHVWDNFAKNNIGTLGNVDLDLLYLERAKQIRETYSYLILHYSGGADSHNILMTFLKNNIKLDEIFVRRSQKVDPKLYTPNTDDKSAENIFSEWDYVIEPNLKWVSEHYPNIKITLGDQFSLEPEQLYNDDMIYKFDQFVGWVEMGRCSVVSDSVKLLSDKGKTIASIYGIDKPLFFTKNNKFYMFFTDVAVGAAPNDGISTNVLFYYSKEMPNLPFEQAYAMYRYFLVNKHLRHLIDVDKSNLTDYARWQVVYEITKKVIYTTWDFNNFQADKPLPYSTAVRTRDLYYDQHPELSRVKDIWKYYFNNWYNLVKDSKNFSKNKNIPNVSTSKFYLIGEFYD